MRDAKMMKQKQKKAEAAGVAAEAVEGEDLRLSEALKKKLQGKMTQQQQQQKKNRHL